MAMITGTTTSVGEQHSVENAGQHARLLVQRLLLTFAADAHHKYRTEALPGTIDLIRHIHF